MPVPGGRIAEVAMGSQDAGQDDQAKDKNDS
jgi:hypothetical protein